MTNSVFRVKLRIIEKVSRRTYVAYWPWLDGYSLWFVTGTKDFSFGLGKCREYNDRGELVKG